MTLKTFLRLATVVGVSSMLVACGEAEQEEAATEDTAVVETQTAQVEVNQESVIVCDETAENTLAGLPVYEGLAFTHMSVDTNYQDGGVYYKYKGSNIDAEAAKGFYNDHFQKMNPDNLDLMDGYSFPVLQNVETCGADTYISIFYPVEGIACNDVFEANGVPHILPDMKAINEIQQFSNGRILAKVFYGSEFGDVPTGKSSDDVTNFYNEELAGNGWSASGNSYTSADGSKKVTIESVSDGSIQVSLFVDPSQAFAVPGDIGCQ